MKKRIFCLFFLVLLGVAQLSAIVSAESTRVFDDAALFTESQRAKLEEEIVLTREQTDLDLAVVTSNNTNGQSAEEYANDFYDENAIGTGAGDDGCLLLIDLEHREVYISTYGAGADFLNDERIEGILDEVTAPLGNGDYFGAANAYLNGVKAVVQAGIADNQHRYDEETGEITPYRSVSAGALLLFAVLAVAAGGMAVGGVVLRYRQKGEEIEYDFRDRCRMQLNVQEDAFLGQAVTSRRIPRADSSSGGGKSGGGTSSGRSSMRQSSSGRSHGGGGRGF